jgi:hypothetical protein
MFGFTKKSPTQKSSSEGRESISFEELCILSNVSSPTETVGNMPKGFHPYTRIIAIGGEATSGHPYESPRAQIEQDLAEEFMSFIHKRLL